ncbi:MAG: DegT/DnrJ/EryC1/StrS family aminotransferase, partial [Winogradskyella sp.]|nr:DegT/DnrJ/EryC1/StrS family aminotransferase [Winogradskyella sp.]
VKTITCGEGGAIVTNNKDYYIRADHFSDHGHDHIGKDRGAENHPFLGYNFRISELNAAVGLAQVKRLIEFIDIQKKNYTILRKELANIKEVTFRRVPEGGVESYAFLNFYLPNLDIARNVSQQFKANGIDACFHYFDNNWHYVRRWKHLKESKSLYPLSTEIRNTLSELNTRDFAQSDHFIGRNLSCLIKLTWTEDEAHQRAKKMREIIEKNL